jgi:hypothetical protein
MKTLTTAAISLLLLAGCATQIHPKDETIQPSKVRLGTYSAVVTKPLIVEKIADASGDPAGVDHIRADLVNCLRLVFPKLEQVSADRAQFAAGTVIIEPAIEDMKRVNGAGRFFAGAMAGSSAVLLRTKYIDAASGEVIASPVFYARASAMSGAWTMGAMDNVMLNRIAEQACSYAKLNY